MKVYGNGHLKFGNGIYRFNSLQTYADGGFEFDPGAGNVDVLVASSMAIGDRTQFIFTGSTLPEKVKFHTQQTNDLTIGTDIQFQGTVVAPLAKVLAYSRTVFHGAVYAKSIDFQPDVKVRFVPLIPTTVVISSPLSGTSTNDSVIQVSWSVSGTVQTTQTTDTLRHFGANIVKRCFGAVCDSILVYLDSVEIPTPKVSFRYCADRYLIYSEQTTQLLQGAETVGGDIGSANHVNVGQHATIWGSMTSVHTAKLEQNAEVKGIAMVGDSIILESGSKADTVLDHIPGLQACPIPTLPKIAYGSTNLDIPQGTEGYLAPGKYGNAQIDSGATLHLSSGSYNFSSLRIENLAALTVDLTNGPIQINIEVYLFIGQGSEIDQIAGDSTQTITIYTNQIDPLFIQSYAGITGILVAPHASVLVADSVEVVGRLYGKTVTLGSGSMVFKPSGPGPQVFPPAPVIPIVSDSLSHIDSVISQVTPGQKSPTWTQIKSDPWDPPAYGAIGDAAMEFAQKMEMGWYEIYGNHGEDASHNPNTLIMSLDPAVDPPAGRNIVRKIGVFENRNDVHRYGKKEFGEDVVDLAVSIAGWYVWPWEGYWETISFPCPTWRPWRWRTCHQRLPSVRIRSKPRFRFHQPDADGMAAADRMQILEAIRRDKDAGRSGMTIWEIGNEPNIFPYILPASYANTVRSYYQVIKQADPNATVAFGSLFDVDFLKADARESLNGVATTYIMLAGLGTGEALSYLVSPAFGLIVGSFITLVLDDVRDDLRDHVFYRYTTRQYFSLVLANLDPSIRPEAISAHYYPFDIEGCYSSNEIKTHIAYTSAFLSTDLYQNRSQFSPVIITETGNMNWKLDTETKALPRMQEILDGAETGIYYGESLINFNSLILWYKPLSSDDKFKNLIGTPFLGIDNPPFTRFMNDGNFTAENAQTLIKGDGWSTFCADINSLGLEYYQRIHGVTCVSP